MVVGKGPEIAAPTSSDVMTSWGRVVVDVGGHDGVLQLHTTGAVRADGASREDVDILFFTVGTMLKNHVCPIYVLMSVSSLHFKFLFA